MSKFESAMRLALNYHQAFNRHDVTSMLELISDDCNFESSYPAPDGTVYSGKESITRFWEQFFRESPEAQIKIEELFGLGERCVMHWKYSWVDTQGVKGHIRGVDIFRAINGAICDQQSYVKGAMTDLSG
jgi:predicted SnoaL-like aldol condensation-catalyzing enzyme